MWRPLAGLALIVKPEFSIPIEEPLFVLRQTGQSRNHARKLRYIKVGWALRLKADKMLPCLLVAADVGKAGRQHRASKYANGF